MNNQSKLLLHDIFKIRLSYEKKDFEEVIRVLKLNDDDYLVNIINLMEELECVSQIKGESKPIVNKTVEIVESVKDTDAEKYALLLQIHEILISKEIFKTVKDLQKFVSQRIHLTTKKNTKVELINKYLSQYVNSSLNELEKELGLIKEESNSNDDVSKFLDMANEIVNSRKEKRY